MLRRLAIFGVLFIHKQATMKLSVAGFALTIVNLAIVGIFLTRMRPVHAQEKQQHALPVLRGRALEIVDSLGRTRASITLQPPVETGGKIYPETVLIRLIDPNGKPMVKIGAAENGSGLTLINQYDEGVVIHGHNAGSYIKITDKGREQYITR